MSPKATAPPPPPATLPKVARAFGLKGLRAYALKLLQQQLMDMQDKKLDARDRQFLLDAIGRLGAAGKSGGAQDKGEEPQGGQSGRDPLKLLKG